MNHQEAVSLIENGLPRPGQTWTDLGAGEGTFTRALGELIGPEGTIYAVDRNAGILRYPQSDRSMARLSVIEADFNLDLNLPLLDGILMANSLHYIKDHKTFLTRMLSNLHPGGSFLLVEYDMSRSNPWVPYPVPFTRFRKLAQTVGLGNPIETGRRRSSYRNGDIYAAVATFDR